jgi:hypothetical protein
LHHRRTDCVIGVCPAWIDPGKGLRQENPGQIYQHQTQHYSKPCRKLRPCYIARYDYAISKEGSARDDRHQVRRSRFFHPDDAPRHVENFINLAKMGFFDAPPFIAWFGFHSRRRLQYER